MVTNSKQRKGYPKIDFAKPLSAYRGGKVKYLGPIGEYHSVQIEKRKILVDDYGFSYDCDPKLIRPRRLVWDVLITDLPRVTKRQAKTMATGSGASLSDIYGLLVIIATELGLNMGSITTPTKAQVPNGAAAHT